MPSEVRHAIRSLYQDSRASFLAIMLLALTIGVTTAVYAVVEAVILGPNAMDAPDRTVVAWQRDDARSTPVVEAALGEVDTWRRYSISFDTLGVFSSVNWTLSLVDGDARARVAYAAVSSSFFDVVGTRPAFGRTLSAADDGDSEPRTVVLSDGFWRERFRRPTRRSSVASSASRTILKVPYAPSRSLALCPPPSTSLAVRDCGSRRRRVCADSLGGRKTTPMRSCPDSECSMRSGGCGRGSSGTSLPGSWSDSPATRAKQCGWGSDRCHRHACERLSPGPGTTRAVDHAGRSAPDDAAGVQQRRGVATVSVCSTRPRPRGAIGPGRHTDTADRRALLESAVLAAAGALCAIGIAWAAITLLVSTAPLDVPRLAQASMVARPVLLGMLGLATFAGVLGGVWPAVFIGRIDTARTLSSGSRAVMHPRERRLQSVVVGWQVAAAVVLLSGAALFVRSVQNLDRTALGFRAESLTSVEVQPSIKELERWDNFFTTLLTRLEDQSDVESAAAVYLRPLSGPIGNDTTPVLAGQEGLGPEAPWRRNARANLESVTPGTFSTLGTRILTGRDFAVTDVATAPNVVIVSASAAERYWPGRDPIGQPIVVAAQREPGRRDELRWQTVVGVVEDVRYSGLTDPRLDVYLPSTQSTMRVKHLMVRTSAPTDRIATIVRAVARELDPGVQIGEVVMMTDAVARESAPWRFAMRVLSLFGGLAAVLATVALVGVISLVVALREKELAVRAALGASPRQLRTHVLERAVWITGAATAVGLVGAFAFGRAVAGLLVATAPHDPLSLGGAALVTLCAGAVGCVLPARRAGAVAPMAALRD